MLKSEAPPIDLTKNMLRRIMIVNFSLQKGGKYDLGIYMAGGGRPQHHHRVCYGRPRFRLVYRGRASTNADSIIGKEFVLLSPIAFNVAGSLKVNDVTWTADTAEDGVEIKAGEKVKVVEIRGNRLIVEKAESQQ